MESKGFSYGIMHTSRPQRKNEKDGEDYFFRDLDFFEKNEKDFIKIQNFKGWKYGLSKKEFEEKQLFVLTPSWIKSLSEKDRKESFIIYLNIEKEIIEKRLSEREDLDDPKRRILADIEDFKDFNDYDLLIKNSDF